MPGPPASAWSRPTRRSLPAVPASRDSHTLTVELFDVLNTLFILSSVMHARARKQSTLEPELYERPSPLPRLVATAVGRRKREFGIGYRGLEIRVPLHHDCVSDPVLVKCLTC